MEEIVGQSDLETKVTAIIEEAKRTKEKGEEKECPIYNSEEPERVAEVLESPISQIITRQLGVNFRDRRYLQEVISPQGILNDEGDVRYFYYYETKYPGIWLKRLCHELRHSEGAYENFVLETQNTLPKLNNSYTDPLMLPLPKEVEEKILSTNLTENKLYLRAYLSTLLGREFWRSALGKYPAPQTLLDKIKRRGETKKRKELLDTAKLHFTRCASATGLDWWKYYNWEQPLQAWDALIARIIKSAKWMNWFPNIESFNSFSEKQQLTQPDIEAWLSLEEIIYPSFSPKEKVQKFDPRIVPLHQKAKKYSITDR